MPQEKVYRSFGDYPNLEFRTYRASIEGSLDSKIDLVRLGAEQGLKLLESFGKQAPQGYIELWAGQNPILDSTYAYLSPPNSKEFESHEATSYIIMPDGSLSEGKKGFKKDNWAEVSVDAQRCLVAPHLLAGKIVSLQETRHISEYWNKTQILEDFLRRYVPAGVSHSGQNWQNKETGKIYETPEVLIPLNAIDVSNSRYLYKLKIL